MMIAEAAALALTLGASSVYSDVVYRPAQRAVSNWRTQAALNIAAPLQTVIRFVTFNEPANLPRCVRLNNYWCVKSARWKGEIASDAEGHVAFSSAHEGALVAAQLLRRYYVDFGRKNATAIVSRWAPAECWAAPFVTGRKRTAGVRQRARPASRTIGLATHVVPATPYAQLIAVNRGRLAGFITPPRKTVITAGMGKRKPQSTVRTAAVRLASLSVPSQPRSADTSAPRIACASEGVRIRNYAVALAKGVSENSLDDLKLFDDMGMPTPALGRVMANMAAVEIGPMKASDDMIARAVEAQTALLRDRLILAPPIELPPTPPPSGLPNAPQSAL